MGADSRHGGGLEASGMIQRRPDSGRGTEGERGPVDPVHPEPAGASYPEFDGLGAGGVSEGLSSQLLPDGWVQLEDPRDGRIFNASPLSPADAQDSTLLDRLVGIDDPSLLPIHLVGAAYGEPLRFQEETEGATLEEWLRTCEVSESEPDDDAESRPRRLWTRLFPEGPDGLVRGFAAVALLAARLREAGIPVSLDHPRRLFIAADGRVLIRARDLLDSHGLRSEETAPYLAPELLLAAVEPKHPGEDTVVYSLACLLHLALTGSPPYPGRDPAEVAHRVLSEERLTLEGRNTGVSAGLGELIGAAVAFDPRSRPLTLMSFAHGCEAALAGEPLPFASGSRRSAGASTGAWRWVAAIVVLAVVIGVLHSWNRERARDQLCMSMEEAVHLRPFPLHGEDPPSHPQAGQLLVNHGESLSVWSGDGRVQLLHGWALLRAGRLPDALRCFQSIVSRDTSSLPGWVSKGIARLEGRDAGGLADLRRGLAMEPIDGNAWLFKGAGHIYLLEFEEACAAFERASEELPRSFAAWFHLALGSHYAGDVERAGSALRHAEELRPRDLWVAWLQGELFADEESPERVHEWLRRDEARFVGRPPLQLRVGNLLVRIGQVDRGREWVRQACERISWGDDVHHSEDAMDSCFETRPRGRLVCRERALLFAGPPSVR